MATRPDCRDAPVAICLREPLAQANRHGLSQPARASRTGAEQHIGRRGPSSDDPGRRRRKTEPSLVRSGYAGLGQQPVTHADNTLSNDETVVETLLLTTAKIAVAVQLCCEQTHENAAIVPVPEDEGQEHQFV